MTPFLPGTLEDPASDTARPGPMTTEFWLTIAGIAAGVALVIAGHPEIGGAILATAIPGYALSRGRAKGR